MGPGRTTVHDLLDAARRRLRRVTPEAAADAMHAGAVLVDIRSEMQRRRNGEIPGALRHPRNVLEWRADPASGHSDPAMSADLDARVMLICDEGYQSSLAAATLKDLGFGNATDVIGGFQAWKAAGLPVAPAVDPALTPDGARTPPTSGHVCDRPGFRAAAQGEYAPDAGL
jgi:rhodanese-related sulfurtransferase